MTKTMICLSCKNTKICKVYQEMLRYHLSEIKLSSCEYHIPKAIQQQAAVSVAPNVSMHPAVDRNNVAEKIRELEKKEEKEPETETDNEFVHCEVCNKKISEEDSIEKIDTKQIVCDECW